MATIQGNEIESPLYSSKTQVFKVTHELGDGAWKRSSLMNRSFISFSYGGKFIEDFNLIATISGDRLQKNVYANFEDTTTTYDTVDGQFYWGTHFTNNSLNFVLATDGITEAQLNEFKCWFIPGESRELYLAETPNRGILARIASTPTYSLLPFENQTSVVMDDQEYFSSTTLYKGEINLSFIMDEPFWYARAALIDYYYTDEEDKINSMTQDATADNAKKTIEDKDFIKMIAEDNIPYASMLRTDALLSDDTYAMIYGDEEAGVASSVVGSAADQGNYYYAHVDDGDEPYTAIVGVKLGKPNITGQTTNINISSTVSKYLYYSGTAPSKPVITFTLYPAFSQEYIGYPLNSYHKNNGKTYNTITVGDAVMKFTLPSIYLGYNQAISIVNNYHENAYLEDIRQALMIGINEYYARAWALMCIKSLENNSLYVNSTSQTITSAFIVQFKLRMKYFITSDGNTNYLPAIFSFDSKTGKSFGQITVRVAENDQYINNIASYPTRVVEENTGDMLRSNYIILKTRNYPDSRGHINNEQCTKISTDYPTSCGGLQDFLITYKNMYY